MKKFIILFLILLVSIPAFGQIRHGNYYLWEADSSSYIWQIVGTERDTSNWYQSYPTMTFTIFARDTTTGANGDSVALTLYYQSSPNKDIELAAIATDTFSVTTAMDSVTQKWRKTDVPTNSDAFYRLIVAGEAGNDKDAGSLIGIYFDGYPLNGGR